MNTESQYINAFNIGYLLVKYEQDFSKMLFQNLTPTNSYLKGFFAGREQFEVENNKDKLHNLEELRNNSNNHEEDYER